jgi:hypothetical protein
MKWKSIVESFRLPKVIYLGWLCFVISLALPLTDAGLQLNGLEALAMSFIIALELSGEIYSLNILQEGREVVLLSAYISIIAFSHLISGLLFIPLLNKGRCRWYASLMVSAAIVIASMFIFFLMKIEAGSFGIVIFKKLHTGYYAGLSGYILVAIGAVKLRRQLLANKNEIAGS